VAIGYFVLGLGLLGGGLLLLRWLVRAEPKQVLAIGKWVLAGLGLLLILTLLLSGRLIWVFAALPALFPLFLRMRHFWRKAKSAMGPTPGQSSEVKTRFLHMTLDHDSGELWGRVLEGSFAGQGLEKLGLDELIELWRVCQIEDPPSAEVLESWLDRNRGEAWREAAGTADGAGGGAGGERQAPASASGAMSREEAYEILGLAPGASEAAIREAHRRLLQKIHPDHGGSNYLAAKINQAKDLLLCT
jgi:hypothetical protein